MIGVSEQTIEARRQAIQTELDAQRSPTARNRLGQFATPSPLAVEIAQFVNSIAKQSLKAIRFGEPAFGTGSFYSAALTVFGSRRIKSAVGVELDGGVFAAARELWNDGNIELIHGDFTKLVASSACPQSPNLILANPPYVRHHHLTREDKARLQALVRRTIGIEVNGLAGLYVYFLLLASAWVQDGGYAAWLIPSEFMDVNYGVALKRFLTERVTLIRAHRFDPTDVQFGDALVSSVVLVFRKSSPRPGHAVQFSFGGTITDPRTQQAIPLGKLRDSRKWTRFPCCAPNEQRVLATDALSLSDLFQIQRGIATGGNKFFILERAEAIQRGFPQKCLLPILPSPRSLNVTVIESDTGGYPLLDNPLCLINCDLPEEILKQRHPALWEYLQTADGQGIRDGYLVGKRTPWYKQEQRRPAMFLCTYMGRGANAKRPFRFIWNRSQAIATNLYLMLYPRGRLALLFRDSPDRAADAFDLLNQVTGHELRTEGRVYGGGLHKIEPKELGRISAAEFVRRWPELNAAIDQQGELFR